MSLWTPGLGQSNNLEGHNQARLFAQWLNSLDTGLDLIVNNTGEKRALEGNMRSMKKLGWLTRDFKVYLSEAVPEGKVQPGKFSNT